MRISSSVFRYATSALWIDRTVFTVLSHNIERFRVWYSDFLDRSRTYIPLIFYIYFYRRDDLAHQYIYCKRSNITERRGYWRSQRCFFEYFYLYILTFYTICRVCLIGFWKVKCTSLSRCADITWLRWRILDIKHQFWIDDERCCPLFVQTSSKSAAAIVLFMRFFA